MLLLGIGDPQASQPQHHGLVGGVRKPGVTVKLHVL